VATGDDRTVSDDAGESEGSAPPSIEPGTRVGRYRILHPVGAGGMGVVYAAHDPDLDRTVAVKVLRVRAQQAGALASGSGGRLAREAQAMARLSHRNVITVHDVGEHRDHVFVAMEFVQGQTLTQWGRAKRTIVEIVDVFIEAGRGLAAAHGAGLVHRDFKPENVMVVTDAQGRIERVLVMDFGLARSSSTGEETIERREGTASKALRHDVVLTQTGGLLGTPAYMSPEQYLGRITDPRSDQFSYCVSLYEMLYGARPFAGDNAVAMAVATIEGRLREPPPRSGVPPWLRRVVLRGLQREPDARWPAMDALLRELARDRGRVRRIAIASIVAIGIGATWAWSYLGETTRDVCKNAGERVAQAWDDDARAQVAAAFSQSDVAYAAALWPRVSPRVDAYASAWQDARIDACHAASIEPAETNALRVACLDRRADHFAALIHVFAQPDAAVIQNAAESIDRLPSLQPCGDVGWLTAKDKPPDDPELRNDVEALRRTLAEIEVLIDTGRYHPAHERAVTAFEHARTVGHPFTVAEAAYALGRLQLELEALDDSLSTLEQAYLTAGASGHDEIAAQAAITLVSAYAVQKGQASKGRDWLKHAQMQAERLAHAERAKERLLSAQSMLEWSEGDYDAAATTIQLAIAMASERAGSESEAVGRMLSSLGLYLTGAGRAGSAKVHLHRSVAILEKELGDAHPVLVNVLSNLGSAWVQSDDLDAALAVYDRALKIGEGGLGPEHPDVAGIVENIAIVMAKRGDVQGALPMFERVLAIRTTAWGADSPRLAHTHRNLAGALGLAARHDEAIVHLQRALRIEKSEYGELHPSIGVTYFEIGNQARELGEIDRALENLLRARDILSETLGERHPDLATVLAALASTYQRRGDYEIALSTFEAALELGTEAGAAQMDLAPLRLELGNLLWQIRPAERARARQLVEQSIAALPEGTGNYRQAQAWLSEHPAR
jgi:tetratricopeptide (TPR) repeat protein